MSNLPQQIARDQYVADGVTTVYAYTFLILSANSLVNDIAVYVTDAGDTPDPAADLQAFGTAYTVQGAGNLTGGTVTFKPGYVPPVSSIVTIVRQMNVSIDTDFAVAQNFNGANLDAAFERVVLILQEYMTALQYTTATYQINAILPPNGGTNILPQLQNNYVWVGLNGQVVTTELITSIPLNTLSSPFTLTNTAVTTTGAQLNYLNFATGTTGSGDLVYSNNPTLNNVTFVGVTFGASTWTSATINSSTINQPAIYQPVIHGVTDGSNAAAGVVGEYIYSQVLLGAAVSLTTGVSANVTSITLSAGDWRVDGNVGITANGQCTAAVGSINTVSATEPDGALLSEISLSTGYLGFTSHAIAPIRINVTVPTIVYLIGQAVFATGSAGACGYIAATRVR